MIAASTLTPRQPTVLIIEDSPQSGSTLAPYLVGQGFSPAQEPWSERAVERILSDDPDLVILDLQYPGAEGLDLCRRARNNYRGGILVLAAPSSAVDEIVALELGADDYVAKPCDPRILLARARSILRRISGQEIVARENRLVVGRLEVDRTRHEVFFAGERVEVTGAELSVLCTLAAKAGEIVSRDELYLQCLGTPYDGLDRGMDIHICRIRRKLVRLGFDARDLRSVRGKGYVLVGQLGRERAT